MIISSSSSNSISRAGLSDLLPCLPRDLDARGPARFGDLIIEIMIIIIVSSSSIIICLLLYVDYQLVVVVVV